MYILMNFLHIAAAVVWLGGVAFMVFAMRPAAAKLLPPPLRMPFIAQALRRFFVAVWLSIGLLLLTGLAMMLSVGMKNAPIGWHLMFGIGIVMFAIFGHLYFGPFRRMKLAVAATDWSEAGRLGGQISMIAHVILALGAAAIAAVLFLA